jgi:hypothetical protein
MGCQPHRDLPDDVRRPHEPVSTGTGTQVAEDTRFRPGEPLDFLVPTGGGESTPVGLRDLRSLRVGLTPWRAPGLALVRNGSVNPPGRRPGRPVWSA